MKKIFLMFCCMTIILMGCKVKKIECGVGTEEDSKPDLSSVFSCISEQFDSINGYYLRGDSADILITDAGPIIMHQSPDTVTETPMFENFNDGDYICVYHDVIMESYPGQMYVYKVTPLKKGDMSNIDWNIILELNEMGWITITSTE